MVVRKQQAELVIDRLATDSAMFTVLGTSPTITNRMSQKAMQELLLPGGKRRTAAARAASPKHDALTEFRDSPYTLSDPQAPTYLALLGASFKAAMASAGVDLPGATRAEIGRRVWIEEERAPLYGVPRLMMSIVRNSDINKTPDVRTRAIIPEWCTQITVRWVTPLLTLASVANLLAAAGMVAGVGDWRPEKGKGAYGQFIVTSPDNERVVRLMAEGGRAAQERAMADPQPYDDETLSLLSWYEDEIVRRSAQPAGSRNGAAEADPDELEVVV